MIPVPSGVRVWLAVGHTDMRRGMNRRALQIQETMRSDPHDDVLEEALLAFTSALSVAEAAYSEKGMQLIRQQQGHVRA